MEQNPEEWYTSLGLTVCCLLCSFFSGDDEGEFDDDDGNVNHYVDVDSESCLEVTAVSINTTCYSVVAL